MDQVTLPKKIVVGLDGSDMSLKALAYAIKLASLVKSKVTVLHVMLLPPGASTKTAEAVRRDLSARGKEMLRKAADVARSDGLEVEMRMTETDHSVETAIVDFATKEKADLIVVGTQGTSGYPKLMLGSTAAGAVSFANCSVLAVR